jgi:hypothetical protein
LALAAARRNTHPEIPIVSGERARKSRPKAAFTVIESRQ